MNSVLIADLKTIRTEIVSGRCRIGASNAAGLPCLLGTVLKILPDETRRRMATAALAACIPDVESRFERPQHRIIRYVRRADVNARSVLRVVDRALADAGSCGIIGKIVRLAVPRQIAA